ncbi:MAG: aminotransferase class III-fold pyridoxal phosphate-dependent enzyme [Solirubrobacterales bacterium]|nr:aminotransferase class III-fold pyridoxal phosphate-dependent enzyme [Solirubrobacterales bacterium]
MGESVSTERIAELLKREEERFEASHPKSKEVHERAGADLLSGVPMNWMTRWPGRFPVYVHEAQGASVVDVDGIEYVDLCLGDTGAMCGHAPAPTVAAIERQLGRGITTMLPSEDAAAVGTMMAERFGMRHWQFTVSATDANRFLIRLCRQITGRSKILVHNHCYHGSVDETVATLTPEGKVEPRWGSVGPPVDPAVTTRVVEINDVAGLERELANEDVACVLIEPALTNIGIVLPDPGYHDEVRRLTREHGTLLIIDETHTLSCGPGGYTAVHGLEPDAMSMGKPIAGGIPTGAYGLSDEVAEEVLASTFWEAADVGGVGGTLAGNALQLAAVRATLGEVLTEEAYERMIALAERYESGVNAAIEEYGLGWSAIRLGCRVEYMFSAEPPHDGGEAAEVIGGPLDELMHLYMLNEGILFTPFHMMALMSPATTEDQVDAHTAAFERIAADLTA